MTYPNHKPERSAQDLTFELATERMAALRATTSGPVEPVATADRGLLDRLARRDRPRADRPRQRPRRGRERQPADRPPLTTAVGSRRTSMSSSGSRGTTTRSAKRPAASDADIGLPAHQLGGRHGRRPDGVERGLTQPDLIPELDRIAPVRIDPAVGPECDPHPGRDGLREPRPLGIGRGLVLGHRLGRPARPSPSSAIQSPSYTSATR